MMAAAAVPAASCSAAISASMATWLAAAAALRRGWNWNVLATIAHRNCSSPMASTAASGGAAIQPAVVAANATAAMARVQRMKSSVPVHLNARGAPHRVETGGLPAPSRPGGLTHHSSSETTLDGMQQVCNIPHDDTVRILHLCGPGPALGLLTSEALSAPEAATTARVQRVACRAISHVYLNISFRRRRWLGVGPSGIEGQLRVCSPGMCCTIASNDRFRRLIR